MSNWAVHKFGGTSVANSERYRHVANLMKSEPLSKAIVVSAMSGVTNALLEVFSLAQHRNEAYSSKLDELKARHLRTVEELLSTGPSAGSLKDTLFHRFTADFTEIQEILRGVWLARTDSERVAELVSGYGEIWSAQMLDAYLRSTGVDSTWLDARIVLTVTPTDTGVIIDWDRSRKQMDRWLMENKKPYVVITGFVASTPEGIPTTLKRNGSDFSASIFGALLRSKSVTIWTDVDGVLSADPRLVPEAEVLDELSYEEATELAYFGAKVVHPSTMAPAIQDQIPIWIKNTFNPTFPGSKIHASTQSNSQSKSQSKSPSKSKVGKLIKGFATIDNVALINVEGTGMIGVPGVAQRLFGALKEVNISVTMISQASSEQSICFAIPAARAEEAEAAIRKTFFGELHQGQIQRILVTQPCSILSAVGDNMVNATGVSGRFFSALGKAGVNILAIAQGSSQRNITTVVNQADSKRALRAAHASFVLSAQTLSVGIIGVGLIGSTLLEQLREQKEILKSKFQIDLRIRGLMNSKHMILNDAGIPLENWQTLLKDSSMEAHLEKFMEFVRSEYLPHSVIIDATASADIAKHYAHWLSNGVHVICPNKKANTSTLADYRAIRSAAREARKQFLYETNVGAGLPIINTLRDLIQTGDQVERIEGILSGTLSFVFSSYDGKVPFSQIIRDAKTRGYTEPDPRDDLSGMDVARKLVILAREIGLEVELSEVQVENLVPPELQRLPLSDFMERLPDMDKIMSTRMGAALNQGKVLRYVGVVSPHQEGHRLSVQLREYPKDHAFAQVQGGDNCVSFKTKRYSKQPLIVQGPGAGPEVTAAGVFADLLRLASSLG